MKRLVFAFALLAVLAVPAPAVAKGPTTAILCGADGCKDLGDAQELGKSRHADKRDAGTGSVLRASVHL